MTSDENIFINMETRGVHKPNWEIELNNTKNQKYGRNPNKRNNMYSRSLTSVRLRAHLLSVGKLW